MHSRKPPSENATKQHSWAIHRATYLVRMLALHPSLIIFTTFSPAVAIKKSGLFSPVTLASALIAYIIYGFSAYKITFLAHETAHNALFRNKLLNQAVGTYSCIFLFVTFGAYARSHLRHHSTISIEEDPDRSNYCWDRRQANCSTLSRSDILAIRKWLLKPLYFGRLIDLAKSIFSSRSDSKLSLNDFERSQLMVLLFNVFTLILLNILAALTASMSVAEAFSFAIAALLIYTMAAASISLFLGRIRTFFEHNIISLVPSSNTEHRRTLRLQRSLRGVNRPANLLSDVIFIDSKFNMHFFHHRRPSSPSIGHPTFSSTVGDDSTSSRLPILRELVLLLGYSCRI